MLFAAESDLPYLLAEVAKLRLIIAGRAEECIHCGRCAPGIDPDHWETCASHPAHAVIARLQAFKDYTNGRLDAAGIDRHDEANAVNGCRIGARLNDALAGGRVATEVQPGIFSVSAAPEIGGHQ